MKVLWLTNSDDLGSTVPEEHRAFRLAAATVERRLEEPVEVVARVIWPSEALPDIIEGWLVRYRPDIVFFRINGFWYLYPSVPLRIERLLGKAGTPVARAGLRAASVPWLAHSRAFHLARRVLRRVVGGDTYFSPTQVLEVVERCTRMIARHENVGLVLRGQLAAWRNGPPGAELAVHEGVRALARELHVHYLGRDPRAHDRSLDAFFKSGDRLHTSQAGHTHFAGLEAEAVLAVWSEMQGRVPADASR